ncbi:MAG: hypothetical protein COU35_03235 [Candidatus Magasanikbacteria bacterium CG10_big_fil_rev_8_21_14_0_10_47_10]|uniref:Uncharacterized protein n=1 Tax=Candidatus Magasanikbacteria bacterium CG10_big_fil_rev_8_21_14_0_10_47_10 TaxID=1974652 RepID=A0A2H0TQ39_9BACT|nr:MAG: hypothetical protein COU35_03235 [Candidatus Magasanikbacteria bacterium CG10_big_fil_rev_8_21_14_0_10_47_10]
MRAIARMSFLLSVALSGCGAQPQMSDETSDGCTDRMRTIRAAQLEQRSDGEEQHAYRRFTQDLNFLTRIACSDVLSTSTSERITIRNMINDAADRLITVLERAKQEGHTLEWHDDWWGRRLVFILSVNASRTDLPERLACLYSDGIVWPKSTDKENTFAPTCRN